MPSVEQLPSTPEKVKVNGESEPSEKDDTPKVPTVIKGTITEAKSLYAKKDKDGRNQWVTEEPVDIVDAAENEETAKYAFLVRKSTSYDSRKKYDSEFFLPSQV